MEDWISALEDEKRIGGSLSPECVAYILYGAYKYGVSGKPVDLGGVFGDQYGVLNLFLSGLYPQIDKMQNFSKGEHKGGKYNNDAIFELARQGKGPKAICEELGYDPASAKSIASNKGYKEGRILFKGSKDNSIETFGF